MYVWHLDVENEQGDDDGEDRVAEGDDSIEFPTGRATSFSCSDHACSFYPASCETPPVV
jgi:hypothetical protein